MKNLTISHLLQNRKFVYLWISQILSQLTINLVTFSILNQIYNTTKSSVAVSLLWLAFSLPIFLFGPLSGSLVDRFDLRKTMYITNFLQGLSVLLFLISGNNIFLLYSLVLIYSALDRFYVPASCAAVPWLLPKEVLPLANGMFFLTQQTSILVGFGLGGVFVSLIGQTATIITSAVFLFVAAWAAHRLPAKDFAIKKGETQPGIKEFFSDIIEGYQLLDSRPYLRFSIALIIFLNAFITVIVILLPSFANEALGLSLQHASSIIIIPAALGALITSLYLPKILGKYRKKTVIQTGLIVAGMALLFISLSHFLSIFQRIILIVLAAGATGTAVAAAMVPANTLVQEQTPHHFGGRIFGLLGFFATVATMLPLMAAASLADLVGAQNILSLLGLSLIAAYIYLRYRFDYAMEHGLRF